MKLKNPMVIKKGEEKKSKIIGNIGSDRRPVRPAHTAAGGGGGTVAGECIHLWSPLPEWMHRLTNRHLRV